MNNKITFFDCLKDILVTKSGTLHQNDGFKEAWNTFMVCRYLSMDEELIKYACEINERSKSFDNESCYKYLIKRIPRRLSSKINYLSKPSKKKK